MPAQKGPPDPPALIGWLHAVDQIHDDGIDVERTATNDERVVIATAFGLDSCQAMSARYSILPIAADQFRLTGNLTADVTQNCVITLEPVAARIDERLNAIFSTPDTQREPVTDGDQKVLTDVTIEPITDDKIDVGALCLETLSAAIDPYPRKPDACLSGGAANGSGQNGGDESDTGPSGAFAELARLRQRMAKLDTDG